MFLKNEFLKRIAETSNRFPATFACAEKDGFQKLSHKYEIVTHPLADLRYSNTVVTLIEQSHM